MVYVHDISFIVSVCFIKRYVEQLICTRFFVQLVFTWLNMLVLPMWNYVIPKIWRLLKFIESVNLSLNVLMFYLDTDFSSLVRWKHTFYDYPWTKNRYSTKYMVPINLTCPHCLQHFFFEHLFHLYSIYTVSKWNQQLIWTEYLLFRLRKNDRSLRQ